MNEIEIFKNPLFGEIRTALSASNEPLFCLADICKAVKLQNPSSIKSRLDKDDVQLIDLHALKQNEGIINGNMMANFVNESGFYDVLLYSDAPQVKPFRKWVTSEVLPSIRKTGGYIATKENDTPEMILARAVIVAQKTIEEKSKQLEQVNKQVVALSNEITTMKPKVSYYDTILNSKGTVTTTQVAQDYGTSAKSFNKQLEAMHIQRKVNGQWILYAPYISQGYVHSKPVEVTHHDGKKQTVLNTEWTQKGRNFLYNSLKNVSILPLIER
nr:phage antirepressor KilAC domain-containing protein [Prevotella sp.]